MAREDDVRSTVAQADAPTVPERASSSALDDLRSGEQIGRYRLVDRLGAGAMGVVWSAIDPQLDRKIAIKLVHPQLARSPEASARLLREARAMAKLSSRAVVTIHDAGEVDDRLFLAMELVDGTTLGARLRERTEAERADWPRWLAILLEAGRGLAAAHRAGVLHRDFKPDNVLVDRSGRVCVGDFGLASLAEPALATAATARWSADAAIDLTTTGALLGTPAYMCPQQLRGEPIDARADQFAFCVATWEALYGARPFQVTARGLDALPALIDAIEAAQLPPPTGPAVPDRVRTALARGLAADPAARWPDLDALLAELERAMRASQRRATTRGAPARRPGARLWIAGGAAAALGAAIAIGIATRPTPPPRARLLFAVPERAGLALSPDGRSLAILTNQVEVRELDTEQAWRSPVVPSDLTGIQVDRDSVRYRAADDRLGLVRWRYREGAPVERVPTPPEWWLASTAHGELVQDGRTISLIAGGRRVQRWAVRGVIRFVDVAPDRRRIAYIDSTRYGGTMVIRDLASGHATRSAELVGLTALAWRDDATVIYAIGTAEAPTMFTAAVDANGRVGPGRAIYREDHGWFGQIVAASDRIVFTNLHPGSRVRTLDRDRDPMLIVDLDRASASGVLGWTPDDQMIAWTRDRGAIELRGAAGVTTTPVVLDGEPANATRADDDTLIVTIRRPSGRQAAAISLATGAERWHHPDLATVAVRCAGDRAPPCFAIRVTDGDDQVVTLDPATGGFGRVLYRDRAINDVAVRRDGAQLTIARQDSNLIQLDAATGDVLARLPSMLATVRSVAYDPRGGLLVAGTHVNNHYQLRRLVDDEGTVLLEVQDDALALVRPSADGSRIQVMTRVFAPDVWVLDLP